MEPDTSYAENVIEFGTAVGTQPLYFVIIMDLDQKLIKVGYQNYQTTIGDLLKNYLEVTSCKEFLYGEPMFKVIQAGNFLGQLAIETRKLASYDFSLDKPCLRVYNSDDFDMNLERQKANNQISKINNNQDVIPVILQIQGEEHPFQIDLKETLKNVKERLTYEIFTLKNESPKNLRLMIKGFIIQDEKATMISYGITINMRIGVIIKKKHGCFSARTNILLKENKNKLIKDIQVGDEVMTYNERTFQFEPNCVTYVHTSILDQCIVLVLDEGTTVETTPNHLFLCEDNIFRKIDAPLSSPQRLQVGFKLKLANNRTASITSINQKLLPAIEMFYHLCIKNNHNFIVNNLIAHNLYIIVVLPNNSQEKVNIQPTEQFINVKEYIEQLYGIQSHNQILVYAGKQLKNNETIADKNIPKESKIYLKFKPSSQFNYLHPQTIVLTIDGEEVPICNIIQGQTIITYDPITKARSKNGDVVLHIQTKNVTEKMVIKLDTYQKQIVSNGDCYYELQSGQCLNVRDLCYKFDHGEWPKLRKIDGSTYQIKEIAHHLIKPIIYYKLILSSDDNYSANKTIIRNEIVNILFIKDGARFQKISLGVKRSDKIISIKQRLSIFTGIQVKDIELTFNNESLKNEETIQSKKIHSEHIITANSLEKVSKSSLYISNYKHKKEENKEIYLQLSQNEKIMIQYPKYKDKTVEEIMKELIPNYQSSFFFLYVDITIRPHELLSKIEMSQEEFGDNVIIVVKNEKWAFIQNMSIEGSKVKNPSYILRERSVIQNQNVSSIIVQTGEVLSNEFVQAANRIRSDESIIATDFKQSNFYTPFLYYTSGKFNQKMLKYIRQFDKYRNEINSNNSIFSIIKDLYINMNMLENCYKQCYFGMKNFKFSQFFKEKDTFYWHSFITAFMDKDNVINEVSNNRGTLFIIHSLNGKQISKYSLHPYKKEVLFAPFSYFMAETIESNEKFDIVVLSEISSPVTFQKNIVLWVDDEPTNNITQIQNILKKNDIEILQVTSTILAEKWVNEFGWLLNWKGLQFKLISDMNRLQDGVPNSEAGVDLLQKLYKEHGISAEILIYCGNRTIAKAKIENRQIPKERSYSIAVNPNEVLKFCKMKE